jgi:hypothetical protein
MKRLFKAAGIFILGLVVTGMVASPCASAAYNGPLSKSAVELRTDMRKLWEDHITYTSFFITAVLAGTEDAEKLAERLLKNQDDIGNALKPIYGDEVGVNLTGLLKDHILIAADLVKAAKAGNKEEIAAADTRWRKNADDIAAFLSRTNPNWPQTALTDMLYTHLLYTNEAVAAKLKKDYPAAIAAYDKGHDHILMMADVLTEGITKQFPDKFVK